jgi:hypothetical protein
VTVGKPLVLRTVCDLEGDRIIGAAMARPQLRGDLMKRFPESTTPTPKIARPLDLHSPLARFLCEILDLFLLSAGQRHDFLIGWRWQ